MQWWGRRGRDTGTTACFLLGRRHDAGLNTSGLVLRNNGADDLTLSKGASTFTFGGKLTGGSPYAVTVRTQPTGESCYVGNGQGKMGTANGRGTNLGALVAYSCRPGLCG